jgi:hypothetical protein
MPRFLFLSINRKEIRFLIAGIADVADFDMPIRIKKGNKMEWIKPETEWKKIKMNSAFSPDTTEFLHPS